MSVQVQMCAGMWMTPVLIYSIEEFSSPFLRFPAGYQSQCVLYSGLVERG